MANASFGVNIIPKNNTVTLGNSDSPWKIVSPSLTGTPTAPTAAAGTHTEQIATTEFVENAKPSVMTGATSSVDGTSGLVPAPVVSEKNKFLRGDGTWADINGKADKVSNATNGNFAALNSSGNLTDSGKKASDFILASTKGANSGVAELDAYGKVPASQLPSFVDDIVEANDKDFTSYSEWASGTNYTVGTKVKVTSSGKGYRCKVANHSTTIKDAEWDEMTKFPATGESGKIYVATNTNLSYRWSGSSYVMISNDLALGETESTAYRGDRGAAAYAAAVTNATDSVTSGSDNLVKSGAVYTALTAKADKVLNSTNGNFAGLDSNGNLVDSGHKHSDYLTSHQDISGKADKSGTVLSTTLSLGRKDNTTTGTNSIALGNTVTSSGTASFAEGYNTTASGNYSHAENESTTASGSGSHAEGTTTTASGNYAHAENFHTTASGVYAHAEGGYTTASEISSHAEGSSTTASGEASHSEGHGTTANHLAQHAGGEYNVVDSSAAEASARGTYIEIIGNGTSSSARSNARALDWSGNEYLKGDLYVGCDASSSNGVKVAVTVSPVFTNSISMGRVSGSTVGSYSTALGGEVIASGSYSHAEGMARNLPVYPYTRTNVTASGSASHAENVGTTASGSGSHAEGLETVASGAYSHTEGYGTIANHLCQRALGEYNVEDTSIAASSERGNYAEIVGNGTAADARSNARALDWNGNERLMGNIYVGCNADSSGGTMLAPNEYTFNEQAVVSAVKAVANVTHCAIKVNHANVAVDGLAAKSIHVLANGGTKANVASAIYNSNTSGLATVGSLSATVSGQTVSFSRPTLLAVSFYITIKGFSTLDLTTLGGTIKTNIGAYVNNLDIAEPLYCSRIRDIVIAAIGANGVEYAIDVSCGGAHGTERNYLTPAWNEKFTMVTPSNDVTVVSSEFATIPSANGVSF